MKTKQEITGNWLQRYTKTHLEDFGKYILLTNFNNYVDLFCDECGVERPAYDANMRLAHGNGITIINFGMGSPNAALVVDLLSAIKPEACLFLGKCGGLSEGVDVGDFMLPIAAIRGEGTSNDYFPPEVPSLPHFMLQRSVSSALKNFKLDYWPGVIYTTNRRVWEHDEQFKDYLRKIRAMAIDMESATLFSCAYYNQIPMGALLLVSDNPMVPEGVKTIESDNIVNANFANIHVRAGIKALRQIMDGSETLDYLKYK